MPTRHIRTKGHGADRRFRKHWADCKKTPTLCGAEPGHNDFSKKDAKFIIEKHGEAVADRVGLCMDCRDEMGW